MSKNKSYYDMVYDKLSSIIRTGFVNWQVTGPRLEDDLEHIFGTQMLAIAMLNYFYEEYQHLDLSKILLILANHEIGEVKYGDYTPYDKQKDDVQSEYNAVLKTTSNVIGGNRFAKLFLDFECNSIKRKRVLKKDNPDMIFDPLKTDNSEFAFYCDKMQCDLKSKYYEIDYPNCVNLDHQHHNPAILYSKAVRDLIAEGNAWSDMWLKVDYINYPYDECFKSISRSATNVFDENDFDNPILKFFYQANKLTSIKVSGEKRLLSAADKIMAAEYLAMSNPHINSAKVVSLILFSVLNMVDDKDFVSNLKGISKELYEEACLLKTKEAKLANYYLEVAFYKTMDYNEFVTYAKKLTN